jgi:predicted Zn-dependent peptidase
MRESVIFPLEGDTALTLQRQVYGQEVAETQLDSGLTVVLLKKPGFTQQFAAFATHYGGMDTSFLAAGEQKVTHVPDGIAHFLEHKLFEEPDGTDVSQQFSQLGMTSNAYTGPYYTVYYFSTVDHFNAGLNILLNFVQTPWFTDATVAKEQGIIEQEIRTGLDNPLRTAYFNMLESMYHYHPVRIRVEGTVESINRITKELLYQCHDTFYHPGNMMLVATGDLDFKAIEEQVRRDQAGRNYQRRDAVARVIPTEPPSVVRTEIAVEMKVSRPRVLMGFKHDAPPTGASRDYQKQLIAANLALSAVLGRITPNYWRLYEKGVLTEGFRFGYSAYPGAGFVWIDGESEDADSLVDAVTQELWRAKEQGIHPDNFEAARRQEIGSFLSVLDNPEQFAGTFITHRFNGLDFLANPELLSEVSLDDGQDFLQQLIRDDNRVVSLVEPLKGGVD